MANLKGKDMDYYRIKILNEEPVMVMANDIDEAEIIARTIRNNYRDRITTRRQYWTSSDFVDGFSKSDYAEIKKFADFQTKNINNIGKSELVTVSVKGVTICNPWVSLSHKRMCRSINEVVDEIGYRCFVDFCEKAVEYRCNKIRERLNNI